MGSSQIHHLLTIPFLALPFLGLAGCAFEPDSSIRRSDSTQLTVAPPDDGEELNSADGEQDVGLCNPNSPRARGEAFDETQAFESLGPCEGDACPHDPGGRSDCVLGSNGFSYCRVCPSNIARMFCLFGHDGYGNCYPQGCAPEDAYALDECATDPAGNFYCDAIREGYAPGQPGECPPAGESTVDRTSFGGASSRGQ